MSEMGIQKNVIIFGAALSCMEKCCRADISFQLMDRMKLERVAPNVHIYNSIISACARSNLWEKGYQVFLEMEKAGVARDVVTYNAVLDAVSSQIRLGRMLFQEGVEKGFYARVSRLGTQWFELDLHFLSLGGGEIALGWWFEECLLPYMNNTEKLQDVNSISIVTGYGKTRLRGRRQGDDGMRKRVKAMLRFMNINELPQNNAGRIHVDKDALIREVDKNGGRIKFDLEGYIEFKEKETTEYHVPDVPQKIRARFRPVNPGQGRPPFIRVETDSTSPEYRLENQKHQRPFDADHHLQEDLRPRGNRPDGGKHEHGRAVEGPGREPIRSSDDRYRNDGGASRHSEREHHGSGRAGPQDAGRGAYDDRRHGSARHPDRSEGRGQQHGEDRGSPSNRYREDQTRNREDQTRNRGGDYGPRGHSGASNDRYGPSSQGKDAARPGTSNALDDVDRYPQDRMDSRKDFDHSGPPNGDRDRYPQDRNRNDHYGNSNSDRSRYPQDRKDNPPGRFDHYGPSSRGNGPVGGKREDTSNSYGPSSRHNDSDRPVGVKRAATSNSYGPPSRGNDSDRPAGGSNSYSASSRGNDLDRPPVGAERAATSNSYFPPSRGNDLDRPAGMKREDFSDRYGPSSRGNDSDRPVGGRRDDFSDRYGPSSRGNDSDRHAGVKREDLPDRYGPSNGVGSDHGPSGRRGGSSNEDPAPSRDGPGDRGNGRKRDYQDYERQQPNRGYSLDRESTRPRHG
jgi:pentatricopeptide repeat protein